MPTKNSKDSSGALVPRSDLCVTIDRLFLPNFPTVLTNLDEFLPIIFYISVILEFIKDLIGTDTLKSVCVCVCVYIYKFLPHGFTFLLLYSYDKIILK